MVEEQLDEWSLPISEDPGSYPAIGNFYWTYLLLPVLEKTKRKEKEAENGRFF